MKTLCIYHGNCADGFGAAWAVRRALGDAVEFHAGVYQKPPPDVTRRDVVLVDFSYKRDVMVDLAKRANSVLVLDHHKSAVEDLAPICGTSFHGGRLEPRRWHDHLTNAAQDSTEGVVTQIYSVFDVRRSGAGIAWDFFHEGAPRPPLIDHIEDRDLWRFALPHTREIQAALFSYPYDFEVWDLLMSMETGRLRDDGIAIERKHHKDIAELVKVATRRMRIGGHVVPVANLPYTLSSDAGHLLAKGEPLAACYFDGPDGRNFSLRSTDDGVDVSEIAKLYGGGGHRNASGFRVPFAVAHGFEIEGEKAEGGAAHA